MKLRTLLLLYTLGFMITGERIEAVANNLTHQKPNKIDSTISIPPGCDPTQANFNIHNCIHNNITAYLLNACQNSTSVISQTCTSLCNASTPDMSDIACCLNSLSHNIPVPFLTVLQGVCEFGFTAPHTILGQTIPGTCSDLTTAEYGQYLCCPLSITASSVTNCLKTQSLTCPTTPWCSSSSQMAHETN